MQFAVDSIHRDVIYYKRQHNERESQTMCEYLIIIELNNNQTIFKKTNNKKLASKFVKKLTNNNDVSNVRWIKINTNKDD